MNFSELREKIEALSENYENIGKELKKGLEDIPHSESLKRLQLKALAGIQLNLAVRNEIEMYKLQREEKDRRDRAEYGR